MSSSRQPRRVEVQSAPERRIAIRFDYASDLVSKVRGIPGRQWHESERCWTIPARTAPLALLVTGLAREDLVVHPDVVPLLPTSGVPTGSWRLPSESVALVDERRRVLERMREELTIRGYSPRTRKVYLNQARGFLRATAGSPLALDASDARRYLGSLLHDRGASHSYADQHVSSLKFLYAHVLKTPLEDLDVPRPRRQRKLPVVLSRREVLSIFSVIENPKHRAILLLVYSAGLRVGEVVRLKLSDLDGDRGLLHIRQGKGRKDRYVPLSQIGLEAVRRYLRHDLGTGTWLFPGRRRGRHLSERTVQHVFARARDHAGIRKPATVHTLRHSYATHLHESGIGLRYIQTLLGHRSPRTTEIYTHVSRADLARVTSPLDQLMASGDEAADSGRTEDGNPDFGDHETPGRLEAPELPAPYPLGQRFS